MTPLAPNSEGLREFNSCHSPDDGKFCSGSSGSRTRLRLSGGKPPDRVRSFLADVTQQTTANPLNDYARVIGNEAIVEFRTPGEYDGPSVHMTELRSVQHHQGAGTRAMRFLTDLADKHKVQLTLTAEPLGVLPTQRKIPKGKLVAFYKRFGFKLRRDGLMARKPLSGLREFNSCHDDRGRFCSQPTVLRGIVVNPGAVRLSFAQRLMKGDVTAPELLKLVRTSDVGEFWWRQTTPDHARSELSDAMEFASVERSDSLEAAMRGREQRLADSRKGGDPRLRDYDRRVRRDYKDFVRYFSIGIVLVGKGPKGWSADENPDTGLMGNSYIARKGGYRVPLTEIHYSTGQAWRTVDARGTSVFIKPPRRQRRFTEYNHCHDPKSGPHFRRYARLVRRANRRGA